MLIVVPDDFPPVLGRAADALGNVTRFDTLANTEELLIDRCGEAEVVVNVRSSSPFTARVIAECPRLRMISIWGTGTDNVDLDACRARGVTVTNTPAVAADAIAEHCLALLLAVARRLIVVDAQVRAGEWPRAGVSVMRGKTLGVIGLGAIGRRFAALGAGIGMNVVTWTMNPKPELGFAHVEFDTLLLTADVVSLHLRLSPDTAGFLSRERIARMKPGAILINTARGGIVDEPALIEALESGHLAGAGLDVFAVEPLPPGDAITRLPNVVLTPHSAGIAPEVVEAGLRMAVSNVEAWIAGEARNVVVDGRG